MIILGFESCAKIASVAVLDGDRILASYSIDNGLTQSELLLPMAESMLSHLSLSFSDVDLLATAVGPGSFTGVRIGVSLLKGLAFGKDTPCVAVSAIEELAENLAGLEGIIVPCMDARRNQVYNALFRSSHGEMTRLCDDRAISLDELCRELADFDGENIYIVGDGYELAKRYLVGKGLKICDTPPTLTGENAVSVCRVAKRKYESGETLTDLEIAPSYLRVPQAERERLERERAKEQ